MLNNINWKQKERITSNNFITCIIEFYIKASILYVENKYGSFTILNLFKAINDAKENKNE